MMLIVRPHLPSSATRPSVRAQDALPNDPPPDIDFSDIGTPEKAALLPALNPESFYFTMKAITLASNAGAPLHASFQMSLGKNTPANVDYNMAAPSAGGVKKDGPITLNGSGKFGSAPFKETWTINDNGSIQIKGVIGKSTEELRVTPSIKGIQVVGHIHGEHGFVDVHELITQPALGMRWDGSIGGKPMYAMRTINNDGPSPIVSVRGSLDNRQISTDATVTNDADGTGFSLSSQGNIAGFDVRSTSVYSWPKPSS